MQGRYAEAEPLYRRALGIWEESLGPNHPNVAKGLSNLADFYHERGREPAAERLYMRAITILENALGPYHPDVARLNGGLAQVYRAEGRARKAEQIEARYKNSALDGVSSQP
jgi:tetratricopeptide (TPR) repeat protein